jgi:hypothetical protein
MDALLMIATQQTRNAQNRRWLQTSGERNF